MGASSSKSSKRLVIVGAGPGGSGLAKIADPYFDVTCIDKREGFLYKPGAPRSVIDGDFAAQCIIPLDKAISEGKMITGVSVTSVDKDKKQVILSDSQIIDYDYLVIAVGARSYGVAEPPTSSSSVKEMKQFYASVKAAIEASSHVALIGGGPNGVEMAGEIRDAYPDKKVTIVHSGPGLCHIQQGAPTKQSFQTKLMTACTKKNIDVKLSVKADLSGLDRTSPFHQGETELKLSDDTALNCDMIIPCIGIEPNGSHLQGLPLDDKGYVKVGANLQIEGFENSFAIGDCSNSTDLKLSQRASTKVGMPPMSPAGQADYILDTLLRLEAGKPPKQFKPQKKAAMVVPVGGGKAGAATLPGFIAGTVLGMKNKDYFVGVYRSRLNC